MPVLLDVTSPTPLNVVLESSQFSGVLSAGAGVYLETGAKVAIRDNSFELGTGLIPMINIPSTSVLSDAFIESNQFYGVPTTTTDGIVVAGGTKLSIQENYFENNRYNISTAGYYRIERNSSPTSAALAMQRRDDQSLYSVAIMAATALPWWSITIPAGTFKTGDILKIRIRGGINLSATAGTRYLRWYYRLTSNSPVQFSEIALTSPTSGVAALIADLDFVIQSNSNHQSGVPVYQIGSNLSLLTRSALTLGIGTNTLSLRFQGVLLPSDTLYIDSVSVDPIRPFEM
jgi:hypothetical protein